MAFNIFDPVGLRAKQKQKKIAEFPLNQDQGKQATALGTLQFPHRSTPIRSAQSLIQSQNLPIQSSQPPKPNIQLQALQQGLGGLTGGLTNLGQSLATLQNQQQQIPPPSPPISRPDTLATLGADVLKAQEKAPEEIEAERQLANLLTSQQLGLQAIREKPIALPFLTGQAKALQERAGLQALPLQAQLAQLQAQRLGKIETAKTQLGIEEEKRKREAGEVREVGGNLVRIKPSGIETLFKKPEEIEKPITISPGSSLVESSTGKVLFTAPRQPTETETLKLLEKNEKNEAARVTQASTAGLINELLVDPNLSTVSGISRIGIRARIATTGNVRAKLAQLKAITALENREKLKGTGAISDFESRTLENAANSLNFAIQDDGRVAMTDKDVKQNLLNIRGTILLKAGQKVLADVFNPETNEILKNVSLTRDQATNLDLEGNIIDFK